MDYREQQRQYYDSAQAQAQSHAQPDQHQHQHQRGLPRLMVRVHGEREQPEEQGGGGRRGEMILSASRLYASPASISPAAQPIYPPAYHPHHASVLSPPPPPPSSPASGGGGTAPPGVPIGFLPPALRRDSGSWRNRRPQQPSRAPRPLLPFDVEEEIPPPPPPPPPPPQQLLLPRWDAHAQPRPESYLMSANMSLSPIYPHQQQQQYDGRGAGDASLSSPINVSTRSTSPFVSLIYGSLPPSLLRSSAGNNNDAADAAALDGHHRTGLVPTSDYPVTSNLPHHHHHHQQQQHTATTTTRQQHSRRSTTLDASSPVFIPQLAILAAEQAAEAAESAPSSTLLTSQAPATRERALRTPLALPTGLSPPRITRVPLPAPSSSTSLAVHDSSNSSGSSMPSHASITGAGSSSAFSPPSHLAAVERPLRSLTVGSPTPSAASSSRATAPSAASSSKRSKKTKPLVVRLPPRDMADSEEYAACAVGDERERAPSSSARTRTGLWRRFVDARIAAKERRACQARLKAAERSERERELARGGRALLETVSRLPHVEEVRLLSLPPTIDIYLPAREAWGQVLSLYFETAQRPYELTSPTQAPASPPPAPPALMPMPDLATLPALPLSRPSTPEVASAAEPQSATSASSPPLAARDEPAREAPINVTAQATTAPQQAVASSSTPPKLILPPDAPVDDGASDCTGIASASSDGHGALSPLVEQRQEVDPASVPLPEDDRRDEVSVDEGDVAGDEDSEAGPATCTTTSSSSSSYMADSPCSPSSVSANVDPGEQYADVAEAVLEDGSHLVTPDFRFPPAHTSLSSSAGSRPRPLPTPPTGSVSYKPLPTPPSLSPRLQPSGDGAHSRVPSAHFHGMLSLSAPESPLTGKASGTHKREESAASLASLGFGSIGQPGSLADEDFTRPPSEAPTVSPPGHEPPPVGVGQPGFSFSLRRDAPPALAIPPAKSKRMHECGDDETPRRPHKTSTREHATDSDLGSPPTSSHSITADVLAHDFAHSFTTRRPAPAWRDSAAASAHVRLPSSSRFARDSRHSLPPVFDDDDDDDTEASKSSANGLKPRAPLQILEDILDEHFASFQDELHYAVGLSSDSAVEHQRELLRAIEERLSRVIDTWSLKLETLVEAAVAKASERYGGDENQGQTLAAVRALRDELDALASSCRAFMSPRRSQGQLEMATLVDQFQSVLRPQLETLAQNAAQTLSQELLHPLAVQPCALNVSLALRDLSELHEALQRSGDAYAATLGQVVELLRTSAPQHYNDDRQHELEMQLMEARKKLDEANAHKEALETRYHDDQETIARLNGQNEILEKRLATLDDKVERMVEAGAHRKQTVATLTQRVSELSSELEARKDLESMLQETVHERDQLAFAFNAQEEQMQKHAAEVEAYRQSFDNLETSVEELKVDLGAQLDEQSEALSAVRSENESLQAELALARSRALTPVQEVSEDSSSLAQTPIKSSFDDTALPERSVLSSITNGGRTRPLSPTVSVLSSARTVADGPDEDGWWG